MLKRFLAPCAVFCFSVASVYGEPPAGATAASEGKPSIDFEMKSSHEQLEMTVQTSRILSIGQKIPQAQVNNPDVLELTPLSPTEIQVSAKKAGVTKISLWGEDQKLYTLDVIVYGDAQELMMLLRTQFPNATLKVIPFASTVLISGYIDQPEHIEKIMQIAEQYYPKPINNMTVGGVQQVLLHVKVMEVSRTKLRRMGFDFAKVTGTNIISSGVSGLISDFNPTGIIDISAPFKPAYRTAADSTFAFNVVDGTSAFFGVLDALRQDNLMKVLSEPTLVTISGRAATCNVGGEIPVPVPQSLGTISIEWKQYGSKIDFVPIVLGKGKIRLEVRPRVSELDNTRSITVAGTTVPGIRSREADTAVELMAGQTLAIAGLVHQRIESENRGLPWISEVPYLGVPFRKVEETANELELLIMVTPELVEPLDQCEVPPCGPGFATTSPTDWELYMKGHLEVPNCCPTGGGDGPCYGPNGTDGLLPPPDGMIGPELVPMPDPAGTSGAVRTHHPHAAVSEPIRLVRRPAPLVPSRPHNRYLSGKPQTPPTKAAAKGQNEPPGFIGPIGYDVLK